VAVPRLSVVIVNYLHWDDTARLVRRLGAAASLRGDDAEVVVVDNHSPPHPLVRQLRRRPGLSLRRWGRNRGFARAVNEGARLSRGEWLLLLNPDTTVGDGFLDEVLRLADRLAAEEPRTGIVGFQLRNDDGTRQLSTGPEPSFLGTLAGLALPRARRKYHLVSGRGRRRVPWVTGCCLLVRRACLEELDGLDEDFFLYYEDVDLCRRARVAGWDVAYEPSLRVVHHRPLHRREVTPHLRVLTRHALLTYAAKHWPAWQARALAGLVWLEAGWRRWQARRRGDAAATGLFHQLGMMTADVLHGRPDAARRRLDRLVRREELQRAR
jgi:GT2 family glycosyltransferase